MAPQMPIKKNNKIHSPDFSRMISCGMGKTHCTAPTQGQMVFRRVSGRTRNLSAGDTWQQTSLMMTTKTWMEMPSQAHRDNIFCGVSCMLILLQPITGPIVSCIGRLNSSQTRAVSHPS